MFSYPVLIKKYLFVACNQFNAKFTSVYGGKPTLSGNVLIRANKLASVKSGVVQAVGLEFANVELIEMRWLDDRLEDALEEAFRTAAQSMRGARILSVQTGRHTRRIAELQIDAAALYESVNNALKLFGDQWLARLHQSATQRLHIDDYERSVLRKLEALDSIYGKLRDRQVQIRSELLEVVVIVLIALEMLVLVRG